MKVKYFLLAATLLSAASLAHAATPAASLTCTANGANFVINLSYFDLGVSRPTPAAYDGGGARTPVLSLTVNAALGSFQTLSQNATAGTVMPTCTLSTVASNGDAVQFIIKSAQVRSVAAQASAASAGTPATSFVQAVLGYASVTVVDNGGGTDDGGASPAGGYDLSKNVGA